MGYARGEEYRSTRRITSSSSALGSGWIANSGLTDRMHASRRRHWGVPRWFAVAVLTGAFVALAFVNYLAR
jgi:hypothetical protein